MRIIPAIDIIDGKCVRLTKGAYATQKIYNENPVEVAKQFEDAGMRYLHMVDLDGAKSSCIVNHKVLHTIASQTHLIIDFGGGLRSDKDLQIAFENGATQVTVGSIAVKKPFLFSTWLAHYGSDKIILGADCIHRKIAVQGWLEQSENEVVDFIKKYREKGVKHVICTDISKDGMLGGAAYELYEEILAHAKVNLIASGGVSSIEDLKKIKEIGCEAVIVGKALYEGTILLKELRELC